MRIDVAIAFALLAAPAAAQHAGHEPQGAAPSQAVGMNAKRTEADVDVAQWARRFEDPGRDVIVHRQAVVEALQLQPGQSVADVGAGTGAYLAALSRAVGPRGKVTGVDISPAFVAHMASRARAEDLANVTAQTGTETSTGLAPASQDVILSVNTFHHFADPQAMLADLHRALKPGGQLAIVDFDRDAPAATDHERGMATLDKAGYIRTIEAAGFRLLEDVTTAGLTQNFLLRFERR